MPAHVCPKCKHTRSKARHQLCNVCWLLDDLIEEHERGEHDRRLLVSCGLCKPKHDQQLIESGAGQLMTKLLAPPLTQRKARLLLKADREGFEFFTRHGEKGSRVMLQLRDEGHLTIEWDGAVPVGVRLSATSRYKALELLASSDDARATTKTAQGHAQRAQSTSHALCAHERTPKARAKCRAERARA